MKKIEKTVAMIAEDTVSVFARIVKELEKLRKRVWDLEQKAMEQKTIIEPRKITVVDRAKLEAEARAMKVWIKRERKETPKMKGVDIDTQTLLFWRIHALGVLEDHICNLYEILGEDYKKETDDEQ